VTGTSASQLIVPGISAVAIAIRYPEPALPAFDAPAEIVAPAPPDTDLDRALQLELRRLFAGTWSGTTVVTGTAGTMWLTRLVAAEGQAVSQRVPDARTDSDSTPVIGAIDLVLDAADCTVTEIGERIASRFELRGTDSAVLVDELLHHKPPPAIVIDRVDSAHDPDRLVGELLSPLAARARRRGLRLVLSFADQPPGELPYEVRLGSEPVIGAASRRVHAEEARERLALLAVKERELLNLHAEVDRLVLGAVRPHSSAPWLRVRLAVATGAERAAIFDYAGQLLNAAGQAADALNRLKSDHRYLAQEFEAYQNRARSQPHYRAENPKLVQLRAAALKALRTGPCDLGAARAAVDAYIDAVREMG
jgi:hypothetical protein